METFDDKNAANGDKRASRTITTSRKLKMPIEDIFPLLIFQRNAASLQSDR